MVWTCPVGSCRMSLAICTACACEDADSSGMDVLRDRLNRRRKKDWKNSLELKKNMKNRIVPVRDFVAHKLEMSLMVYI